jgi:NAD(P)-dependent dehydrogenase (short-subunit alcohol dehydrogenase family)
MTVRAPDARVAVITGSTSGIGLAIARRLCRDGFHVAVTAAMTSAAKPGRPSVGRSSRFTS